MCYKVMQERVHLLYVCVLYGNTITGKPTLCCGYVCYNAKLELVNLLCLSIMCAIKYVIKNWYTCGMYVIR